MPYSQFKTVGQVKQAFNITTQAGIRFFPSKIEPIQPSPVLSAVLEEGLAVATATGSEKARSEFLISPVLLEVRRILDRKVSLFSGEEFTVDESQGLNGVCDFLISHSPELLEIEAPVVVLVEAKRADLKLGMAQCMAEMVAAQRFNQSNQVPIQVVYGCVTSGTLWRFMKLEGQILTVDLMDYALQPVGQVLSFLVWMIRGKEL
jgi:hypothetical protein